MVHSYLKMEEAPTQKCKMPNYFNKDSSRQKVSRVNYGVQERKKSAEVCLAYGAQRRARHLWAGALGPGTFYFRSFLPPEDSLLPFSTVMAAKW